MPPGPLPPWRHLGQPAPKTHRGTRNKSKNDKVKAVQEARRLEKRIGEAMPEPSDGDVCAGDVEHRESSETQTSSATQVAREHSATHVAMPAARSATQVAACQVSEQDPSASSSGGVGMGTIITDQLVLLQGLLPVDREAAIKYIEVFGVPLRETSDSDD